MKKYVLMALICLVSLGMTAQNRPTQPQEAPPYGQHDNHGNHHGNGGHDPHYNDPHHNDPHHSRDYQDGYRDGYRDGQRDERKNGHHHQPAPAPKPMVANAEQLQWALQIIEKQSYDDKRMEVAKLCVVLCPFQVRDLARMVGCFTMEDRKVDFLIFAHHYCVDKENYYMFRDVLRYRSDYDKLMERVQPGYRRM